MKVIKDPIKLAKELIGISSVSRNEQALADYIYKYLKQIGLKPKYQEISKNRSNVLVRGSGSLLIDGHLDTVPVGDENLWRLNPYGQISNKKLYGRGACDTKGSIACVLAALANNPSKKISCAFTVGEEDTFIGIKSLMKLRNTKFKKIKYCIELEPTDSKIITAHKGQFSFIVRVRGKAAHASVPEEGDNAILKMAKIIAKIESYSKALRKRKHPLLGHPTLNIGVIRGGIMSNIVPDYAELTIDRRALPNERVSKVIKEMRQIASLGETTVVHQHKPVELNPNSPAVKLMQSILKKYKKASKPAGVNFTTQFSEMKKHGIGGLVFGVGSVNQAHKADEFVFTKDLKTCHLVFSDIIQAYENS